MLLYNLSRESHVFQILYSFLFIGTERVDINHVYKDSLESICVGIKAWWKSEIIGLKEITFRKMKTIFPNFPPFWEKFHQGCGFGSRCAWIRIRVKKAGSKSESVSAWLKSKFRSFWSSKESLGRSQWRLAGSKLSPSGFIGRGCRFASLWWGAGPGYGSVFKSKAESGSALKGWGSATLVSKGKI